MAQGAPGPWKMKVVEFISPKTGLKITFRMQPEMGNYNSRIYEGRVSHQRLRPRKHHLSYRVFSMLVDLDELPSLHKQLTFFSHNQFNLFSFWDKDYGCGHDTSLAQYARNVLNTAGLDLTGGAVKLLCYPRLFGYAFNPLSVYYCYDLTDDLKSVIPLVSATVT